MRALAFDLVDHGDAPARPDATADDVVSDATSRVAAIDGAVILVGHSFGAWVAGRVINALGSTKIARFIAIAGVPGLDAATTERSLGLAAALEGGQLTLEAGAALACDLWLPAEGRRLDDVAAITDLITGDSAARLARVLRRQVALADPARHVAPHDVPTTSIHATGDRGAPVELGRRLASLARRSEWIELAGDSHFPMWTHPAEVARAVFRD